MMLKSIIYKNQKQSKIGYSRTKAMKVYVERVKEQEKYNKENYLKTKTEKSI